jgi:hypothetical protein
VHPLAVPSFAGPHARPSALLWRELLAVTRNPADVAGRMLIFTWIAVLVGGARAPAGRAGLTAGGAPPHLAQGRGRLARHTAACPHLNLAVESLAPGSPPSGLIYYDLGANLEAVRSRLNVLFLQPIIFLLLPYVYMSLYTVWQRRRAGPGPFSL